MWHELGRSFSANEQTSSPLLELKLEYLHDQQSASFLISIVPDDSILFNGSIIILAKPNVSRSILTSTPLFFAGMVESINGQENGENYIE